MCLEICPFLLDFPIYLNIGFQRRVPVYCYLPFVISNFINLGLFPPHFIQIYQEFVNLTYFFKNPAFCFIDSLLFVFWVFFGIYLVDLGLYLYYFSPSASFRVYLVLDFLGL
jgi:hypothetical protein